MIDVEEAHRILFSVVKPGPAVRLSLREALFRTLADDVLCDVDYPPFDRSVMDGFAVRAADIGKAPVRIRLAAVAGAGAAGAAPDRMLQGGEAMPINTGAPIPPGADSVVRVEDTERPDGDMLLVKAAVEVGNFITPKGLYVRAGEVVLRKGQCLTPTEIGAAASAGAATVSVFKPPTVAVLSTGSELIGIERVPTGAQIRNSNEYQLDALVRTAHLQPVLLGVAGDEPVTLRAKLADGLQHDVCCITGGVSMGAFDFVPGILKEFGAVFHIEKMAIKPGRPVIFATTPSGCLVFALPGNPVSAFVGFELLVRPAIAAMEGRQFCVPMMEAATLRGTLPAAGARRAFLPARATFSRDGRSSVEALSWHGSGDAIGLAGANAMIVRPPSSPPADEGQTVSVFRFPY